MRYKKLYERDTASNWEQCSDSAQKIERSLERCATKKSAESTISHTIQDTAGGGDGATHWHLSGKGKTEVESGTLKGEGVH